MNNEERIEEMLRLILGKALEIDATASGITWSKLTVGEGTARIGRALDEQREAVRIIRAIIADVPW